MNRKILIILMLLAISCYPQKLSYKTFNSLLQKNVKDGLINYSGFGTKEFAQFIDELKNADITEMNRNQELAFWINAYNALTIKNVLDNPGIKSPINIDSFFTEKKFTVSGWNVSLDDIEHQIIRKEFNEPLIHFGLVCAAKGCPKIRDEIYTEANVVKNLKENTRNYFSTDRGFVLNRKDMTVYLTSLMKWFREDFGNTDKVLLDFVVRYIPKSDALFIAENRDNLKIDFIEYNWELNSQ